VADVWFSPLSSTNKNDRHDISVISAIFLWREIAESCWTQSEQVKNRPFERGCRWFQLFFIDNG
jgi:hypothetical protein